MHASALRATLRDVRFLHCGRTLLFSTMNRAPPSPCLSLTVSLTLHYLLCALQTLPSFGLLLFFRGFSSCFGVSRHRNDLPVATTALLTLHSVHVPRPSLSPSICESIHCGCVAARPSPPPDTRAGGRAGGRAAVREFSLRKASPVRTNGRTNPPPPLPPTG